MKRKIKLVLFILVGLLLMFLSYKYSVILGEEPNTFITIQNTNDKKMVYILNWMNHPYFPPWMPFSIAGGELESGRETHLSYRWGTGSYFIRWYEYERPKMKDSYVLKFQIMENTKKILITDEKVEVK